MGSLVDPSIVRRTEHYAVILEPQHIVDMIATRHSALTDHSGAGGFGFALSARGADDAILVYEKVQRIVPHLHRALDASLLLGRLADGTTHLARALQIMPNPALVLDGKGRVKLTNAAADALLTRGDGLVYDRSAGGTLTAAQPAERRALAASLAGALDVAFGAAAQPGEPVKLTRASDGRPLVVLPIPLPSPTFELWELREPPRVLVLIIDPGSYPGSVASLLQSSFRLTAAEARVAELVSAGLTGPQVAKKLGVSPTTIKTQLGRVFEKTGVNSQVALARLVGAFPAVEQLFNGKTRS
jgi:DNA-binding CsgD family transcriptional regulator